MATEYHEISAYNEDMLGKDRASRMSQVSMYADTAHFVYEILQNADDAGAKEVVFKVFDDRLVIEHDGNPFTPENVNEALFCEHDRRAAKQSPGDRPSISWTI